MNIEEITQTAKELHQAAGELREGIDRLKSTLDQHSGLPNDEVLHLARGVAQQLHGLLGAHLADGLPKACKAMAARQEPRPTVQA